MPRLATTASINAVTSGDGGNAENAAQQRASQCSGASQARTTRSDRVQHDVVLTALIFFPPRRRWRDSVRIPHLVADRPAAVCIPPAKDKCAAHELPMAANGVIPCDGAPGRGV